MLTSFCLFAEDAAGQTETQKPAPTKQANLLPPALGTAAHGERPETTAQRDARMKWWREARFGMFIHWGLYSVGGGKWNGQDCGFIGSWMQSRLRVPPEEYATLRSGFTAKNYDPKFWAKLAKTAGMKYAVITAKHHEGFCLYDSKYTEYDVMSTPAKRDLLKGYFQAFRAEGLKTGLYYSLFDWNHPDYPVKGHAHHPMSNNPQYTEQNRDTEKYINYLHAQARELATNYGKLDIIWWDFSYDKMTGEAWRARDLIQMMHTLQPGIIMNNRLFKDVLNPNGDFATPEQYVPPTGTGSDWETCQTMNETWGYKPHDHQYKSSKQLIRQLTEVVSKGGNYLLNVGPKPDGTIPAEQVKRLKDIGKWMDIHSESIYGTKASPFPKTLPWGYCTQKMRNNGNTRLYLHVHNRPEGDKLVLRQLGNKVISARYLSGPSKPELQHMRMKRGVSIVLPAKRANENVEVIVLDIHGKPQILPYLVFADVQGAVHLTAKEATLHGGQIKYDPAQDSIGSWVNSKDTVSWKLHTGKAGRYRIIVNGGVDVGTGGVIRVSLAGKQLLLKTSSTGGWFKRKDFVAGEIDLPANTQLTFVMHTLKISSVAALDLHKITISPVEDSSQSK